MKDKLLLIDAYSIICRGFYALPLLSNDKGLHTNAVLGFLNILYKNIDEEKPKYIAVAFDENKNTFRHKMYKDYKAQRGAMPDELKEQVPYVKKILTASNINMYSKEGFEADDILGTLANKFSTKKLEAVILSGDKDMLQLATDNIKIRLVKTVKADSNTYEYYAKDVENEYKLTPTQFIDMKALMGDPSDNIKGLKGIGPKTATDLLVQYGDIENIYTHIDEIKKKSVQDIFRDNIDEARFCKDLVTIRTNVDIDCSLDELLLTDIFNDKAFKVIEELGLKSQYKRFGKTNVSNTKAKTTTNSQKIDKIDNPFDDNDTFVDVDNQDSKIDKKELSYIMNQTVSVEASKVFENINKSKGNIAVYLYRKQIEKTNLLYDGDIYLCAITTDSNTYVLSGDYSKEILGLIDKKKIITKDLKQSLFYLDDDLSYDKKFILSDNIKENIDDVSIMAYLIDSTFKDYDLPTLAKAYLGIDIKTKKDYFGKQEEYEFCDLNKQIQPELLEYLSYNSKIIYLLYDVLNKKLKELKLVDLYKDIELPLVYVLYNMEKYGIRIDEKLLAQYDKKLDKRIEVLTKEIKDLAGKDFNINSPKQLGEVLFTDLKLTYDMRKGEKLSTSVEVLEKLQDKHPIIKKIMEYRTISKLSSTYAKGLPAFIKADNRIHTNYNQTETATGRLSSDNPNMQNIPIKTELGRELRKVFIPTDGFTFIDADYSQIELRLLAIISKDEKLIKAYSKGNDVHTITASEVFGVPIDKVTSNLRRKAKAVNFGIIYGMSSFGLSEDLHIDTKEARDYINKYFDTYKKVKEYLDDVVKKAEQDGYTRTIYGRIRPINEFKSSVPTIRAFAKRVAMNSPIQGSASDIMKKAMILVDESIEKAKLKSRIVLQVHDELLIDVKSGEEEKIKDILNKCMKEQFKFEVALDINISEGSNFEEAH